MAQRLKRLPAMWETWVRSLGQEDPLEKEMATHSSILAEKSGGYSLWGRRELDKMIVQLNTFTLGFPGGSDSKVSARNVGDLGSIPGLGRSPGEGNGNPLQYSCLENSMDGGAW